MKNTSVYASSREKAKAKKRLCRRCKTPLNPNRYFNCRVCVPPDVENEGFEAEVGTRYSPAPRKAPDDV